MGILLVHPKSLNQVVSNESTIPTYMRYFYVVPSKFVCANSNFQNEFPFCVPIPLVKWQGWPIFFHARCVNLKMSVYSLLIKREYDSIRDARSWNEKEIYFMLSNNKFLGKCWYGRYPWIWLASRGMWKNCGKGINFIFCLGTAYDISSMRSVGNYSVVFVDGKSMPLKKNYLSV